MHVSPKTLIGPFRFGVSLYFNGFHYYVPIGAEDWKGLKEKETMALLQIGKAKTRGVLSVLRKELTEPLIIFAKHVIVEVSQSCEYIYRKFMSY